LEEGTSGGQNFTGAGGQAQAPATQVPGPQSTQQAPQLFGSDWKSLQK
jgi:hypothetical protein